MYTYQYIKIILFSVFFVTISKSQEADTTLVEEDEGGREMYTSVDISYSQDKGNTDFLSLYYGLNFTLIGDIGTLKDTEFLFDFNRSDDQFEGQPFTDDQSITLKFDVWANKRFSPFLFFQKSFDNTIGLEDRLNYGLGAKVGLNKMFSVSYALLAEKEDYLYYDYTDSVGTGEYYYTDSVVIDTNYYYYDFYWGDDFYMGTDSTEYYEYTDSTEAPAEEFFRHSIRPKIKLKLFDDNLVFDYRFYFKPKVDDFNDYLLEHELKVSLSTFYEALTINLNYTNKFNSRYDSAVIINRDTGIPYKAVDENLTLGFSFMF
tara:strand:- start:275 stop:1225 length:951 start_codon:yes stop_codon:yes gene_type:complete